MKLPLVIQVTLLDLTEWSRVGEWFVWINCQCCNLYILYIEYNAAHCTHTHAHTHSHTHTHAHTHTLTHTYTHVPTAQENTQIYIQTCTASRHYHIYMRFANSCGYSRPKSCSFERARVNSGCAICANDFKAKSCALRLFHATDACQTLACVSHGSHPLLCHSCHFSMATV